MCGAIGTYLARGTIVLFAIVVLALAVPPLYVGGMFLNRGSTMFLATPLPDYLPWACIGASLLLLAKFVVTIRGACSPDRKLSLALAMVVTLILMTLSACACAMCFEVQRSVVDPDAHNVFVGHFFSAVRHRFERMFDECEPTAYATDRVNAACEQLAPPEMQGCTLNPPGRAGVYCTAGPGLSPFTLDTTLRFARQGLAEVLWEELSKAHSAGWWVSAMCMPQAGAFLKELRRIPGNHSLANRSHLSDPSTSSGGDGSSESGSGGGGGGGGSNGVTADSADEDEDSWPSFAECYASSWWDAPAPANP